MFHFRSPSPHQQHTKPAKDVAAKAALLRMAEAPGRSSDTMRVQTENGSNIPDIQSSTPAGNEDEAPGVHSSNRTILIEEVTDDDVSSLNYIKQTGNPFTTDNRLLYSRSAEPPADKEHSNLSDSRSEPIRHETARDNKENQQRKNSKPPSASPSTSG